MADLRGDQLFEPIADTLFDFVHGLCRHTEIRRHLIDCFPRQEPFEDPDAPGLICSAKMLHRLPEMVISPFAFPLSMRLCFVKWRRNNSSSAIYPPQRDVWTAAEANYFVSDNSTDERAELSALRGILEAGKCLRQSHHHDLTDVLRVGMLQAASPAEPHDHLAVAGVKFPPSRLVQRISNSREQ